MKYPIVVNFIVMSGFIMALCVIGRLHSNQIQALNEGVHEIETRVSVLEFTRKMMRFNISAVPDTAVVDTAAVESLFDSSSVYISRKDSIDICDHHWVLRPIAIYTDPPVVFYICTECGATREFLQPKRKETLTTEDLERMYGK